MAETTKARLTPLVAGNWKMNGVRASLAEAAKIRDGSLRSPAQVVICPPATLISALVEAAQGSNVGVGGQDCHVNRLGRPYRRYLGGHAARRRGAVCHRRPF